MRIQPKGKERKDCSYFDSALVAFTSKGFVHNFELDSHEFRSKDCEFKSDRNVLCNLLESIVTNEKERDFVIHSQVHNSKKGDHAPR